MIRNLIILIFVAATSVKFLLDKFWTNDFTPTNVAYVEANLNPITDAACYLRSDNGKPYFNVAIIFAATLEPEAKKHPDPNYPVITFSKNIKKTLDETNQVEILQKKGIKVLLTIIGNYKAAGWSCLTDEQAIQTFANNIVEIVDKYHLDGVDIDDEYSTCKANPTSMIRIARAIKNNPKFKGKLLTKALYDDALYFLATYESEGKKYKLSDFLDFSWQMTYDLPDFVSRLEPYKDYGMLAKNLYLGVSVFEKVDPRAAAFVVNNGFGGIMAFHISSSPEIREFFSNFAKIQYDTDIVLNCSKTKK